MERGSSDRSDLTRSDALAILRQQEEGKTRTEPAAGPRWSGIGHGVVVESVAVQQEVAEELAVAVWLIPSPSHVGDLHAISRGSPEIAAIDLTSLRDARLSGTDSTLPSVAKLIHSSAVLDGMCNHVQVFTFVLEKNYKDPDRPGFASDPSKNIAMCEIILLTSCRHRFCMLPAIGFEEVVMELTFLHQLPRLSAINGPLYGTKAGHGRMTHFAARCGSDRSEPIISFQ
ncbi:hypothetical protein ZHAS_00019248 [Anopheles sinensis]|uniref:Uncharacterized protein n=1 Tax=Anopheles sinensis TaxID=74873 RepID=A0A084WL07_ANOSI|nr:hypothetical protein ZHAS_00019248 [Anopheles sinensis]